jgi:hypothetical protein
MEDMFSARIMLSHQDGRYVSRSDHIVHQDGRYVSSSDHIVPPGGKVCFSFGSYCPRRREDMFLIRIISSHQEGRYVSCSDHVVPAGWTVCFSFRSYCPPRWKICLVLGSYRPRRREGMLRIQIILSHQDGRYV